jgi:hypothetical protein
MDPETFETMLDMDDSIPGSELANDSDGHLSSKGDDWVRDIACVNILIYTLWCNLMLAKYSTPGYSFTEMILETNAAGTITLTTYKNTVTYAHSACYASDSITTSWVTAMLAIWNHALLCVGSTYQKWIDSGNVTRIHSMNDFSNAVQTTSKGRWDLTNANGTNVTRGLASRPGFQYLISNGEYVGDVLECADDVTYCYVTPKYDKGSFWASIIIGAAISIAVIVTAVVITVSARKAIRRKQLKNNLAVESAYDAVKLHPTKENIKAYEKVVMKNNLFSSIFGGTKYSKQGYWVSTESTGGVASSLSTLVADKTSNADPTGSLGSTLASVDDVMKLINPNYQPSD